MIRLVSRLADELREKHGLVYDIDSSFRTSNAKGPFYISLETRNEKATQAITLTQQTLNSFFDTRSYTKRINRSKQYIIGSFPIRLDSNRAILSAMTNIAFYQLPLDYLDTYRDRISTVTLAQIHDAFKRHINPQQFVTVKVGPQ